MWRDIEKKRIERKWTATKTSRRACCKRSALTLSFYQSNWFYLCALLWLLLLLLLSVSRAADKWNGIFDSLSMSHSTHDTQPSKHYLYYVQMWKYNISNDGEWKALSKRKFDLKHRFNNITSGITFENHNTPHHFTTYNSKITAQKLSLKCETHSTILNSTNTNC